MFRSNSTELRHSGFAGRIGVARTDITPNPEIYFRNWGSSAFDTALGVHRPLLASVIVFGLGTDELVLISLDLGWWRSADDESGIRLSILQRTGLTNHQLMLHLSHTHSAPPTSLDKQDCPGGHLIAEFREQIVASCADAIGAARSASQDSVLTWATGRCGLAQNRNFVEPLSGSIYCGLNLDETADDTVLVGRIANKSGSTIGVLVNYACHPISLGGANRLISPDYVGAMRETVEQHAPDALCIFLHGASGDVGPRLSYSADTQIADQNGRELGFSVLSCLTSMLPPEKSWSYVGLEDSGAPLGKWNFSDLHANRTIATCVVSIPLELAERPSRNEIEKEIANTSDRAKLERLKRRLLMCASVGDDESRAIEITVWRLGDSYLVSTPAEASSNLQVRLRAEYPGTGIAVMNIVNGYMSYLPAKAEYATHSYQVGVALFKKGCLERVIDGAARAILELSSNS